MAVKTTIARKDFEKDFYFGAATAAYQVEGGYNEGGRSMSNWDVWSMTRPEKIADGSNGCVATDHYNKYEEDVLLMKKLGLEAYRFSISWTRILPGGRLNAGVNREGVEFYNKLINLLLKNDIEPFVTLFHFEVPQVLQLEYGGFLNPKIVQDFVDFAKVCFFEFGDRVKYWITLNEPWSFSHNAYVSGGFPPGHGSNVPAKEGSNRPLLYRHSRKVEPTISGIGDPANDPYIVAHNLIIAHAKAAEVYKRDFQPAQGGKIGMTNMTVWSYPYDPHDDHDVQAAARAVDFMWGWFVEPMVMGDYPPVMREKLGDRLPKFSAQISNLLKQSYDFIGMNYYTAGFAQNAPRTPTTPVNYHTDQEVMPFTVDVNGNSIGEQSTGAGWLHHCPRGLKDLLIHTKNRYNDPIIYITENGWADLNDPHQTISQACDDKNRIKYLSEHIAALKQAKDEAQVKVKGYFTWSLMDNYEWMSGYDARFGLIYVDYANGYRRYPKNSALWYMNFLGRKDVRGKRLLDEYDDDYAGSAVKRIRNR